MVSKIIKKIVDKLLKQMKKEEIIGFTTHSNNKFVIIELKDLKEDIEK